MPEFHPCTLGRGVDGNASEFFAKTQGFGYNDMISLPTLTKDSILDNLHKRFKARARARSRQILPAVDPPRAAHPAPAALYRTLGALCARRADESDPTDHHPNSPARTRARHRHRSGRLSPPCPRGSRRRARSHRSQRAFPLLCRSVSSSIRTSATLSSPSTHSRTSATSARRYAPNTRARRAAACRRTSTRSSTTRTTR